MEEIIIIHPDDDLHYKLGEILGNQYHLESFYQGLNAFVWMQSGHKPDLVIINDTLADVDVREVLGKLKNSGYYSDIPVVVLSSTNNNEAVNELLENGADEAILYPISGEKVKSSVMELLEKK